MCKGLLVEQRDVSGGTEGRVWLICPSLHTSSGPRRVPDLMDQKVLGLEQAQANRERHLN